MVLVARSLGRLLNMMKCSPGTISGFSLALACFQRSRPTASTFLSRSAAGSLASCLLAQLLGGGRVGLHGRLGVDPRVEPGPLLHPLRDLGDRLVRQACLVPLGHPRLLLALDPQDQVALVRLAGDDRPCGRASPSGASRMSSGPACPCVTPARPALWQPTQLATRIGAMSCENLSWPESAAFVSVAASFLVLAFASAFLVAPFSGSRAFLRAAFARGAAWRPCRPGPGSECLVHRVLEAENLGPQPGGPGRATQETGGFRWERARAPSIRRHWPAADQAIA